MIPDGRALVELERLARVHGLETSYFGADGERRVADAESCRAVLCALGVPVEDPRAALAGARRRAWSELAPPVLVSWDRRAMPVGLRLPVAHAERVLTVELRPRELVPGEPEEPLRWRHALAGRPRTAGPRIDGVEHARVSVELPAPPGLGTYDLELEVGGLHARSLVLSAPLRSGPPGDRAFGLFLPLHALRTARDWGCGDLGDLAALARFAAERGARFVGTLPLAAPSLADLASPYTPSSRRSWNELFVDVEAIPELAGAPRAREILASSDFQGERARLSASPLVDHEGVARLKARVLAELFDALSQGRREKLLDWAAHHGHAVDHARFRAVLDRRGEPWRTWPAELRDGRIGDADHDPLVAQRHLYAQWIAAEQLAALRADPGAAELYLDLPVGVHPDGHDAWRERALVLEHCSIGAPPDPFFAEGQDWGLPAWNPRGLRADGHRYLTACLRHHLSAARWLRIDHVMGLARLFVVPHGAGARNGVYVRQPFSEQLAVVALEAYRANATIVGEDLGTVAPRVRSALARHGFLGMYVLPFELDPRREPALAEPAADRMASLDTHDTPTFAAAFSEGSAARAVLELALRERGLTGAEALPDLELLRAALRHLAGSPACAVLVALEDLWLETRPQNRPGTTAAENWRGRSRYALEALARDPQVLELLAEVRRSRATAPTVLAPRHGT